MSLFVHMQSTCCLRCLFLCQFYLPGEVEPKHLELSTQANNFLWRITLIWGKCCTWQGPKLATIMHSKSWCICKIRLPVTIWISISWVWMVQKLSTIKTGSSAGNWCRLLQYQAQILCQRNSARGIAERREWCVKECALCCIVDSGWERPLLIPGHQDFSACGGLTSV